MKMSLFNMKILEKEFYLFLLDWHMERKGSAESISFEIRVPKELEVKVRGALRKLMRMEGKYKFLKKMSVNAKLEFTDSEDVKTFKVKA